MQTTLSFVMLVFMTLTGLTALAGHGAAPATAAVAASTYAALGKDWMVLGVVALAFWVFVGSEFVTPLVVESRNPHRDLPRAMITGLLVVFVVQALFALGAALLMPRQLLATSATPHLDYVVAVFGPSAKIWFGVIAVTATASLLNTVLASVPRMLQGMAENGQVLPIFKRTSRLGTPVFGILFVGALPLIGLVWSRGDATAIVPLTVAASVAWLLAYMTAQVSLMVLRQRHPELKRPFKVPGYPVTPVLALAGMAYVVINSSPAPEMTNQIVAYTGIVLALFGVVGALWIKVVMKQGLFTPTTPAGLHADMQYEI